MSRAMVIPHPAYPGMGLWLWTADGPNGHRSGVVDSEKKAWADAQKAAAEMKERPDASGQ